LFLVVSRISVDRFFMPKGFLRGLFTISKAVQPAQEIPLGKCSKQRCWEHKS